MTQIDRSASEAARARRDSANADLELLDPPYDPRDPVNRAKRNAEGVPAPTPDPNNPQGQAESEGGGGQGDGNAPPNVELPGDFPALELLRAAGHDTLDKVRGLDRDALIGVSGIGSATADKVLAYLASTR